MKYTVSPPPVSGKTLSADPALQTWFLKAGQHLTEASSTETLTGKAGEILTTSRSGSRIYWEYAGTKGDSWVFQGVAIVLPASTTPQQGWTHLKEAPSGNG